MTQMENKQQQTFDFNRAVQVYMRWESNSYSIFYTVI